ncbi:sensor histidine kinase [Paenibacillus sp. Marseille-Q4541]|uniref:sensor histidine kinase n=1 Tax=Paenibacillus sp. Marseille-Q4541 TaxID=2831522 RepID=UPI002018D8D6|nr:sensor histidine kinase [Paenibacillus sp. Marseille-Q4541]
MYKLMNPGSKFLPFGWKLFISYLILIILPVVILAYTANSILVDSMRTQTVTNLHGTLAQMRDNVSYKLRDTERISDMLYYDETLALNLMRLEEGWISYETTSTILLPKFRQAVESTNQKLWLSIYLRDTNLPEIYYDSGDVDLLRVKDKYFDVYHINRIQFENWYKSFPPEQYGKTMKWTQVDDDEQFERISLLRRLVNTVDPLDLKEIGFMRGSVYLSELFESMDYNKIGPGSLIQVINQNGTKMYSTGDLDSVEHQAMHNGSTSNQLVIHEKIPELDWTITAYVPQDILEKGVQKVTQITLLICLLFVLLISAVASYLSRYISKRFSKLISVLVMFQQGDYHKRIHYKGTDEFTLIADALNKMGAQTEHLIEEVYETNLKKKQAELESLQAQINPHFLYNTLSSISRLAKFGRVEQQHEMIMNLAKFYRLTLNDGQTIISIYKELEQVKAYLDIQKVKYGDRMEVDFDIDPDILRYETIKLILQPFIENALEHAWCGDRIYIRVIGEQMDDKVVFQIIDDGIGMKTQYAESLLEKDGDDQKGYGIFNVHERIQLSFGEEFGVAIYSRLGIGTNITIIIPIQKKNEI